MGLWLSSRGGAGVLTFPFHHLTHNPTQHTGFPAGYGFVEFLTHEIAERVLETCNGTAIRKSTPPGASALSN